MASSVVRRGFRLSVSASVLFRPSQALAARSSTALFSSRCFSVCPVLEKKTRLFKSSTPFLEPIRYFSVMTGSDNRLTEVIKAEIQEAKDGSETHDQYPLPSDFQFSITDNAGDQSIILERDYSGETIRAKVFMNMDEAEDNEDENEDENDQSGDEEGISAPDIFMEVTIDKGDNSILEFYCRITPEEIEIDSMALKERDAPSADQEPYEGPQFSDLDEKLQNEFHRYLEERGFTKSLFGFLQDYMVKKDEREYITWLQNIQQFVEA